MKLNDNSIFDKAVVVTLIDDKLYYENATTYMFDADLFNSYVPGVLIYKGIDFSGRCAFWVEDDDAFPIVKYNDTYLVIEHDDEYEYLKMQNALSVEQIKLIDEGFNVLNRVVTTGGWIDYNGGI